MRSKVAARHKKKAKAKIRKTKNMETEAVKQLEPVPPKPVKISRLEEVLPAIIIEMIKKAPTNEVYRAHVLASLKRGLPDEADTFDKIKEWIECNIPKGSTNLGLNAASAALPMQIARYVEEEGTCNYTRQMVAQRNYEIAAEKVRELAQITVDDEYTFQDFLHRLRQEYTHVAERDDRPWGYSFVPGTVTPSNFEMNDQTIQRHDLNINELSRRVRDFMCRNGMVALLEELDSRM